MVRKKVDARIRTLIENGVKEGHRSMFLMVGDKGKEQIVNLHYILAKAQVKSRPSVLWCYKKDLGFSSNRKKRARQIKKEIRRGVRQVNEEDPFELFITSTKIRYCYYRDTTQILGQTFGMLVLSDFEALTPNLLARTVETVEGGGIVVLLLKTMKSLRQLYSLSMDVHKRFRTQQYGDVVGRFNERFLLSIASCRKCLAIDDELNVLALSRKTRHIKPVLEVEESKHEAELKALKADMKDSEVVGDLINLCVTLDQAKCVLVFVESIMEKTLRSTVSLTAGRGRGKSAALGISLAAAIAHGYSNVFVTSPSPENLNTVFEFLLQGLKALGMKEHTDYNVVSSTNPDFNNAVIRVNIFQDHRQTVQYISPQDHQLLAQAEILIIDEAAAIPLPMVKKLMGPYLIFMSSTINGYEGTGRSLSLKLIKSLKKGGKKHAGRNLRELTLEEPIRYKDGDAIEAWLVGLLCLDCLGQKHTITQGTPALEKCQLYHVNRDTLFSYNKISENFLQRLMSLYVSSHYKNSPNDLQLISDAPAHELFVLLGPQENNGEKLPDVLVVIQVSFEGKLNQASVKKSLIRGKTPAGDMIPWVLSQQFQDAEFGTLNGARIVRIATHPELLRMKYGSRAMQLLSDYFAKKIPVTENSNSTPSPSKEPKSTSLLDETLKPRKHLPPLLTPITERPPESLDWIGVAYGITEQLFLFWKKAHFDSIYMRQTANKITGEHTVIMLKEASGNKKLEKNYLKTYTADFQQRLMSLSSIAFRHFHTKLSLIVLDPSRALLDGNAKRKKTDFDFEELSRTFSVWDLKRLSAYSRKRADYHIILDLTPKLAHLFFSEKLNITMSFVQCAILNALGLQHKSIDTISSELRLPANQILALFTKVVLKFVKLFDSMEKEYEKAKIKKNLPAPKKSKKPVEQSLDDELDEAAKEEKRKKKEKQAKILSSLDLSEYQIAHNTKEWKEAIDSHGGAGSISVAGKKRKRKSDDGGKKKKKKKKKNKGKKSS